MHAEGAFRQRDFEGDALGRPGIVQGDASGCFGEPGSRNAHGQVAPVKVPIGPPRVACNRLALPRMGKGEAHHDARPHRLALELLIQHAGLPFGVAIAQVHVVAGRAFAQRFRAQRQNSRPQLKVEGAELCSVKPVAFDEVVPARVAEAPLDGREVRFQARGVFVSAVATRPP